MLLSFSGIDCSGKSTQISYLRRYLEDRGLSVRLYWLRPGYSRELDFLRATVRRIRPSALPSADRPQARQKAFERPGVSRLWLEIAVTDLLAQYTLKLRALMVKYDVVLCDRYLWDATLDLELRFPIFDIRGMRRLRGARRLSPTPDKAFMLLLDEEEMLVRMEEKDEPFPDPPALRAKRYERYRKLPSQLPELEIIDAHGTPEEVHHRIRAHIEPLLSSP